MIKPDPTCFLIADISGYTEYLSGVEIDHAQDILADLISTVVTALKPTFRLAKLEGDAAFCFAPTDKVDASLLLDAVERCYFGFRRRRRDVRQATSCECNACLRIPDLNLKFVAHHGLAITQKVAGQRELLGSDVILVHRLLKNTVVETTGVSAYALFSDALIGVMGIDPAELGMREHTEVYDHIGEVKVWVLDLERRWQEEDARARVFVSAADAVSSSSVGVTAPPQVVWEYLTVPGRRIGWQLGATAIEQEVPAGRRGVGMTNHCVHGSDAIIEKVVDWRPYDYLTEESKMFADGPTLLTTIELEPTAEGTTVHYRFAQPKKAKDRQALQTMGPILNDALRAALAELATIAGAEGTARTDAAATDPALPGPKSPDNFLAGVQPIDFSA